MPDFEWSPKAIEAAVNAYFATRHAPANLGTHASKWVARSLDAAVKAQPVVALPPCPTCGGDRGKIQTRVVAAFPGTGKSYAAALIGASDSDSSTFARGREWPDNYIDHIRALLDSRRSAVFVSTHEEVRRALVASGISFTLAYPAATLREEYRERMVRRGSPAALITKVVDDLWDVALASCRGQNGCEHRVLARGQYLLDLCCPTCNGSGVERMVPVSEIVTALRQFKREDDSEDWGEAANFIEREFGGKG